MLSKIWQFLKQLFQQLLIIFPLFPKDDSQKHTAVTPPRLTLTDAEYELIFMELLEEVNLGRSSGNLAGFLMAKGVKDPELAVWLRSFGERLLASNNPSVASLQELARRLVLLSEVRGGKLGGVAGEFGRGILAKFPLPIEVNQEAEEWLDRGNEQFKRGYLEGAIASYNKAIEFKPDKHAAWHYRAEALDRLGRFEEAIASYDKAIKFKPDYHEAWSNRGVALFKLGRNEEALASYNKAIEFKPDYHEAWHYRGCALANLGRYEEAIASYDKAIEFNPDDVCLWDDRAEALDKLGRNEEASASLDKAIQPDPDLD